VKAKLRKYVSNQKQLGFFKHHTYARIAKHCGVSFALVEKWVVSDLEIGEKYAEKLNELWKE
jgi:hypothetical protein